MPTRQPVHGGCCVAALIRAGEGEVDADAMVHQAAADAGRKAAEEEEDKRQVTHVMRGVECLIEHGGCRACL